MTDAIIPIGSATLSHSTTFVANNPREYTVFSSDPNWVPEPAWDDMIVHSRWSEPLLAIKADGRRVYKDGLTIDEAKYIIEQLLLVIG